MDKIPTARRVHHMMKKHPSYLPHTNTSIYKILHAFYHRTLKRQSLQQDKKLLMQNSKQRKEWTF